VIDGEQPLTAIDKELHRPSSERRSGAGEDLRLGAETVVFTLDSDESGVVDAGTGGRDEENGRTRTCTCSSSTATAFGGERVRDSTWPSSAADRYDNGDNPPPLFEYFYDDDNDLTTATSCGAIPTTTSSQLGESPHRHAGQCALWHPMIKVNVVAEGTSLSSTKDNQGFAHVVMSSRVYIRNADSHDAAHIFGTVFFDANTNGKQDSGESGLPGVVVTASPINRKTQTDKFGQYSLPVDGGPDGRETVPVDYFRPRRRVNIRSTPARPERRLWQQQRQGRLRRGYGLGRRQQNAVNDGE
jgi:hypothetical protein